MDVTDDVVHIIGVGGIGSHLALNLARRRPDIVSRLHVWDHDIVTPENLQSQHYDDTHVGMRKVDALARQVTALAGAQPVAHAVRVEAGQPLAGIVFVCVDRMDARLAIWKSCIVGNSAVRLMVEGRVEAFNALIHTVEPQVGAHESRWESYWYPDDPIVAAAGCGATTVAGPICELTADLMLWQFANFASRRHGESIGSQIRVRVRPRVIVETFPW